MPRRCEVCRHESRAEIDSLLARGETLRDISRQHRIGKDAIRRHSLKCIPSTLAAAKHEAEVVRGRDLGSVLSEAYDALRRLAVKAEEGSQFAVAGKLQGETLRIAELLLRASQIARERTAGFDEALLIRRTQDRALELLFGGMPDGLRIQLAAWVNERREERLRAQVEEGERRLAESVLPLSPDDGAREAARADGGAFHRDGIRAQCSCGRWLRFDRTGAPLPADLCSECLSRRGPQPYQAC
jgi:hypothetical protein